MDIHKPKPVHSWREFLSEIAVIVCGVLIALALEQLVSALDWQTKLREAREGLSEELAENLGKSQVRILVGSCVERRLDALSGIVDQAARTGTLPALPKPIAPPYNSWASGVWQSTLSAQTASHMPADELRTYTRVYQVFERISAAGPEELAVWTTLFGLAGPGRAFDAADARIYREAIGQARNLNGITTGFGVRARQLVDTHHLPYSAEIYHQRVDGVPAGGPACAIFAGSPPPAYGVAPAADFADYANAHPVR